MEIIEMVQANLDFARDVMMSKMADYIMLDEKRADLICRNKWNKDGIMIESSDVYNKKYHDMKYSITVAKHHKDLRDSIAENVKRMNENKN